MSHQIFKPTNQATVNGVVTASSTDIAITQSGANCAKLLNVGTQTVFWKYDATVAGAATVATSTPIAAGESYFIWLNPTVSALAVIAAGAGSTLYVTPGVML